MKTKSKPKSQSKPKSKGCRRAATCSPRSIAKKIAKHLFTVGGTPQNDKATHLCLFDGGHKGKYLSGWSEAAAVYAIERIIQANALDQAQPPDQIQPSNT